MSFKLHSNDTFKRYELPVHLILIKITSNEASQRWGFTFEEGADGNGTFHMTVLELDNGVQYFWLCYPQNEDDMRYFSVSVHADVEDHRQAIDDLLAALDLSQDDVIWTNENLGKFRWRVTYSDAEGVKGVLSRHVEEEEAKRTKKQYGYVDARKTYFLEEVEIGSDT